MPEIKDFTGKTLSNRYEILRPLGEGGMGKVYLAKDKRFGKQVVVKVPTMEVGDKDFKARFMREIASIATLEHAYIVPTIDWGEMEGIPFLVLRYLSGGSLRNRITDAQGNSKRMPIEGLNQWLPQIASALDYIHSKNWIHRDLKPDNILFDEAGNPYLADFGIAKTLVGSAMGVKTSLGSVTGTPQYMAPEMHLGKGIGPRADQFGLAVLVYEALAGKVPFQATTSTAIFVEIMQGNVKPIVEIISNIPLKKSKALLRGMAKEAKDRFENCVEMSNAITGGKLVAVMPKVAPVIIDTISNSQVNTLQGELQKPSILPTRVELPGQVNETKTNNLASKSAQGSVDPPIFKTMIESNKISNLNSELSPPSKLESSIKNNDGSENFLKPPGHQNLEFNNPPPLPPSLGQSNLLMLLNNLNKVIDSAKNLIQSDKTKEKVAQIKTHWDRSSKPIKFAVIGVSSFLALLVVWSVFSWMFGSKFEMVLIPSGKFMMGSPKREKDRDSDEDQHEVTITKPFYMGKYEVTQEQWESVMGKNPSETKGVKLPVTDVSWDDCQEFIKKLNDKTKGGYRLPTEAEWEYACRAGTKTAYSFGDTITPKDANWNHNFISIKEIRNQYEQGKIKPVAVGSYKPNAFGLYDMHGNVYEWCEDWKADYPKGSVTNPKGADSGERRVLRGGSFSNNARYTRSALRNDDSPDDRNTNGGFRLARTP